MARQFFAKLEPRQHWTDILTWQDRVNGVKVWERGRLFHLMYVRLTNNQINSRSMTVWRDSFINEAFLFEYRSMNHLALVSNSESCSCRMFAKTQNSFRTNAIELRCISITLHSRDSMHQCTPKLNPSPWQRGTCSLINCARQTPLSLLNYTARKALTIIVRDKNKRNSNKLFCRWGH